MSGHNKWSQIKRQKGKTDAQKSKVFSKYARLISSESKKAGGNISAASLMAVIDLAKKENVPKDVIERAIKKGTEASTQQMESITYEAYGPGGCAIIIEALTENRNKAAQEIKHILAQHELSLASIGSAVWAFARTGVEWNPTVTVPLSDEDLNLLTKVVEALEDNDEVQAVFTNAE
ncbi:MAG: YebC/PmpR family DNA-binding transcriptional regulator [Candidatus Pacebacteria bacterium]|nr:YebC/PmpR family DNA-binding transcriptional regulator [Candidatus Paceibacterota bacterium]